MVVLNWLVVSMAPVFLVMVVVVETAWWHCCTGGDATQGAPLSIERGLSALRGQERCVEGILEVIAQKPRDRERWAVFKGGYWYARHSST